MATKITREVLESYLECKYKAHLTLAGEQGTRSDYELLMMETREQVCLDAPKRLLVQHKEGQVLRGTAVTPAVLRRGAPLLLDATAEDQGLSVRFDALQRVDGPSGLGDFHYIPILFHGAEKLGREQRILLELLGLILEFAQGRVPGWGVLVHGRNCEVQKIKLTPNVQQARRILAEVREIQNTATPPRLRLNGHCQVCEFRQRCHTQAVASDDLSLLRGIGEKEVARYVRRGIFTVTQLSCTFRCRKGSKRQKRVGQPHYHALQALAVRDKKIYVLGSPELPTSTTRIHLDIEGDPERGFDYLLGMIVETNGSEVRHSFWADSPHEEVSLFERFLDVIGSYGDFRLYVYGSYEAAFLRRMVKKLGRPELGERLLPRLVNVLSIIYSHIYFPTYSNGLKDIAGYLGFRWTERDASGVQSIVWRRRWESTGAGCLKDKLTKYNMEDCVALKKVTTLLNAICSGQPKVGESPTVNPEGHQASQVEEMESHFNRREWCKASFLLPEFEFVNDRASFDYQRDRVFIRTSETLRKNRSRKRRVKGRKAIRANRCVEISSQKCSFCGGTELTRSQDGRLVRQVFDLQITGCGIRRSVSQYSTTWHCCAACQRRFLPHEYLRLDEYGHSIRCWSMYEHVAHRSSFANLAETIQECFGLRLYDSEIHGFKASLARYYAETYRGIQSRIVGGHLVHADETEIHLRKTGKGYVWIFTNMEEVVFMYRKSREGDFLRELLSDFRGVLVSDFYGAYDSLRCKQQKCLIHLMRDFNHDLRNSPWDQEFRVLAADFGRLLRKVVATVDSHGLRKEHLSRHGQDVAAFFQLVEKRDVRSEVAQGYRNRLLKYQHKLFTFLDHDGVPWNNNNAEHAVKRFAHYREVADGRLAEAGLNDYLVLLSVYATCEYKGVSFLNFLLSRETDIDVFRKNSGKRRAPPDLELHPDGIRSTRPSRNRSLGGPLGRAITTTAPTSRLTNTATSTNGVHERPSVVVGSKINTARRIV